MRITHYIGIDGGGTKTEAVLTNAEGRVLCSHKQGPSNPNDIGLDASAEVIASLIRSLLHDACISASSVSVFCGISGALALKDDLKAKLCMLCGDVGALSVHSDVINLLSAGSPTGNGVCLICGTGSVCFLRSDDTLHRVGGWGYLLDSAGGGYDIGRMALEASLKACDGRADIKTHTPLLQAVTRYLGASPHEMITEIYQKGKSYIASCAPLVFELAEQGDAVAKNILDVNAQALAECITAAARKIDNKDPVNVILGGSICTKASPAWTLRISCRLPLDVKEKTTLILSDVPPVFGALTEAMAMSAGPARAERYSDFKRNFMQTYHP
ncbi:MAG: hypothetical protein IJW00_09760 [Clostridia bacterium]|nr:hypothetical protein [Clostridia bacterium]